MIISYDRISSQYDSRNMLCAKVSNTTENTQYNIVTIPPTFELDASLAYNYGEYVGFIEAIDRMEQTTQERKDFLKMRFPYWKNIGPSLHCFGGQTTE